MDPYAQKVVDLLLKEYILENQRQEKNIINNLNFLLNHTTQYQCKGQEGGILDLKQSFSQLFDQNDTLAVDYYDFFIEKFVSAAN